MAKKYGTKDVEVCVSCDATHENSEHGEECRCCEEFVCVRCVVYPAIDFEPYCPDCYAELLQE